VLDRLRRSNLSLPLTLLVTRIRADDVHTPLPLHQLAVLADAFHARTDFHGKPLGAKITTDREFSIVTIGIDQARFIYAFFRRTLQRLNRKRRIS